MTTYIYRYKYQGKVQTPIRIKAENRSIADMKFMQKVRDYDFDSINVTEV